MKCPSEIELNEYAEDRLETRRRWEVQEHLEQCAGCRTDLEGLCWTTGQLAALSAATAEADHPSDEDLAALAEGKLAAAQRARVLTHLGQCPECATIYGALPRRRRTLALPSSWSGLAAAAALLLAIGIFTITGGPRQEVGIAPPPRPAVELPAPAAKAAQEPTREVAPPATAAAPQPARKDAVQPPVAAGPALVAAQPPAPPAEPATRASAAAVGAPPSGARVAANGASPRLSQPVTERVSPVRVRPVMSRRPEVAAPAGPFFPEAQPTLGARGLAPPTTPTMALDGSRAMPMRPGSHDLPARALSGRPGPGAVDGAASRGDRGFGMKMARPAPPPQATPPTMPLARPGPALEGSQETVNALLVVTPQQADPAQKAKLRTLAQEARGKSAAAEQGRANWLEPGAAPEVKSNSESKAKLRDMSEQSGGKPAPGLGSVAGGKSAASRGLGAQEPESPSQQRAGTVGDGGGDDSPKKDCSPSLSGVCHAGR